MAGKYTYAELPAISLAIPINSIAISGGGLCIADGRKPTAFLRGPDGTLTPVYGKVTIISSVPNQISGPVNISGSIRGVYKMSDHPHPAASAQQVAIRLAQEGKMSLGMLRSVLDR